MLTILTRRALTLLLASAAFYSCSDKKQISSLAELEELARIQFEVVEKNESLLEPGENTVVSIRVTDADGAPIPYQSVKVRLIDISEEEAETVTVESLSSAWGNQAMPASMASHNNTIQAPLILSQRIGSIKTPKLETDGNGILKVAVAAPEVYAKTIALAFSIDDQSGAKGDFDYITLKTKLWGPLAEFAVTTPGKLSQTAGEAFALIIEARDKYGVLIEDYNEKLTLSLRADSRASWAGPDIANIDNEFSCQFENGSCTTENILQTGASGSLNIEVSESVSDVSKSIEVDILAGEPSQLVLVSAAGAPDASVSIIDNCSLAEVQSATNKVCLSAGENLKDWPVHIAITDNAGNFLGNPDTGSIEITGILNTASTISANPLHATFSTIEQGSGSMKITAAGIVRTLNYEVARLIPATLTLTDDNGSQELTNSPNAYAFVSECPETSQMLLTTSNIRPTPDQQGWIDCSTTAVTDAAWAYPSANGEQKMYLWLKRGGHVSFQSSEDTIELDTTAPGSPSLTLYHSNEVETAITDSRTIKAKAASCEAETKMILTSNNAVPDENSTAWTDCVTTIASHAEWKFADEATDGSKTMTLWLKDKAGNVSTAPASSTIILDTTPPNAGTLTLYDDNLTLTTLTNVTDVYASASNCEANVKIAVTQSNFPPSAVSNAWTNCSQTAFTFANWAYNNPGVDGNKTMYLWAMDQAFNVSSNITPATIELRTAAPTSPAFTLYDDDKANSVATNSTTVYVAAGSCQNGDMMNLTVTDPPAAAAAGWVNCSTTVVSSPSWAYANPGSDGSKTLKLWIKNPAGGISITPSQDSIILDTTPPLPQALTLTDDNFAVTTRTNTTAVYAKAAACSSGDKMFVKNNSATPLLTDAGWVNCSTSPVTNSNWQYSNDTADGSKQMYLWILDQADNMSTSTTNVITLDRSSPSVAITSPTSADFYYSYAASINIGGTCDTDVTSMARSLGTFADDNCINADWSLNAYTPAFGLNTFTVVALDAPGNSSQDVLEIYRPALGNGTYATGATTGVGSGPEGFAVGDFNADGVDDFAVGENIGADVGTDVKILISTATNGVGDGTIASSLDLVVDLDHIKDLATADFNADGILDLVAISYGGGGNFSVFLGNGSGGIGNGTFAGKVDYSMDTNDGQTAVTVADFNADSILDLAITNALTGEVLVFKGDGSGGKGDGSFSAIGTFGGLTTPVDIAHADFNHDGALDLAVVDDGDDTIKIYLGNKTNGYANGTFNLSSTKSTGSDPARLLLADLDENMTPDIAVTNYTSDTVGILRGNPDGSFQNMVSYLTGANPVGIAIADQNADGGDDLIVVNESGNSYRVLLANTSNGYGDGKFLPQSDAGGLTTPNSVATTDLNKDGIPDLVVTNTGANTLKIMLGNGEGKRGDGTFTKGLTQTTDFGLDFSAVDFNRDNVLDIVLTHKNQNPSDQVDVYLGGGFNGHADSRFSLAHTQTVAARSPIGQTFADFNADRILDVATSTVNTGVSDDNIEIYFGGNTNGAPNGTLTAGPTLAVDSGFTTDIASGDFNDDNITDLVLMGTGSNRFHTFLGNGTNGVANGTFATAVNYDVNEDNLFYLDDIVVSEFNGDGILDIAVTTGGDFQVFIGNGSDGRGNGTFAPPSVTVGNCSIFLVEDLNKDGHADVICAAGSSNVEVYLGQGDATFANAIVSNLHASCTYGWYMTGGDYNDDGIFDIAVSCNDGFNVLLGNGANARGNGNFTSTGGLYAVDGDKIIDMDSGDFNADGILDIIVLEGNNDDGEKINIYLGDSQ